MVYSLESLKIFVWLCRKKKGIRSVLIIINNSPIVKTDLYFYKYSPKNKVTHYFDISTFFDPNSIL